MTLTKEGKVVLLVLVGFALGAINTGTNLLYVLTGGLLNIYLLSLWVTHRSLGAVQPSREGPREAMVGIPVEASYALEVSRSLPHAVCVSEAPPADALSQEAPPLGFVGLSAGVYQASGERTFTRRGRHELPGLRVSCRAPFGLIERAKIVTAPWHILVLPAARTVKSSLLEAPELPADAVARRWRGLAQERRDLVRSLRDYTPGDSQRAVHWRSSARRGELVVKEFERTAPNQALVLLDLATSVGPQADQATEAAVVLAASLQASLIRSGQRTGLGITGEGGPSVLPPAQGDSGLRRGLRALALARPAADPDVRGLIRSASQVLQAARVFLVTTRPAPPPELAGRARVFTIHSAADAEACYAGETP